jgi:Trk-type K+ transport system membrane component
VRSAITNQNEVNLRSRRIPKDQINKAIAIISLSVLWIIVSIFALLILEPHIKLVDIAIESISALSNLGLSTNITPTLSGWSKTIILLSMIVGRIGSLTLILALRKIAHWGKSGSPEFSYPEERIMLS